MAKSRIFIGIVISFGFGIWLASKFNLGLNYILIALAFSAGIFVLSFISGHKGIVLGALFLFCAGLGALRLQQTETPNEYQNLFDVKQTIEGKIVEDIDLRQNKQLITFQPKGFSQRILITTSLGKEYSYGNLAVVEGKIKQPQAFDDFDYPKYLERFNVYALMSYPKLLVLKDHTGNFIKDLLLDIKHKFTKRISKFLPEPENSLLLGILIGARKTLPQNIVDNFNNTGVSHIIAISGYNISIIIAALGFLARLLGRKWSFWLSLTVILGFVIMAGPSASVVRAMVMGFMLLVAFYIGRPYSVGPALFFAAFIMLLINPKILFWDIGFQLSFAATLGIVYFMPLLEKLTANWPNFFSLKEIFFTTMSAIIATLPLILLYFGRLSLTAPAVNILILPIIPLTMLLGFLSALPFLGPGFAFASKILLDYILKLTGWFASWTFSSLSVQLTEQVFLCLAIAVLGLYLILWQFSKKMHV